MTPAALLAELRSLGFAVRAEAGRLLVAPPGGRWHPADAALIRETRAGLLAALRREASPPTGQIVFCDRCCRCGAPTGRYDYGRCASCLADGRR
jgi:predicted ATPase